MLRRDVGLVVIEHNQRGTCRSRDVQTRSHLAPLLSPNGVDELCFSWNFLGAGVLDWNSPALVLIAELHLSVVHVLVADEASVVHHSVGDAAIQLQLPWVSPRLGPRSRLEICRPMCRKHRQIARGSSRGESWLCTYLCLSKGREGIRMNLWRVMSNSP